MASYDAPSRDLTNIKFNTSDYIDYSTNSLKIPNPLNASTVNITGALTTNSTITVNNGPIAFNNNVPLSFYTTEGGGEAFKLLNINGMGYAFRFDNTNRPDNKREFTFMSNTDNSY